MKLIYSELLTITLIGYIAIEIATFPGLIIHKLSIKLFFWLFNIPGYNINCLLPFFKPEEKITYKKIGNLKALFFISIAPLLVNSLLCMIFTFPYGFHFFLDTGLIRSENLKVSDIITTWIGYSIGFQALPNYENIENLDKHYNSKILIILIKIIKYLVKSPCITDRFFIVKFLFNQFIKLIFAQFLSLIIPTIFQYFLIN